MSEDELSNEQLEIKDPLLVSCPNTGGLVYVHGKSHLTISYSDVTGISNYDGGFLWVLQSDGARSLQMLGDDGIKTIELDKDYIDLHDVLVSGDDIYAVHTETNDVVKYNKNFEEVDRWGLKGELDSAHINCITIYKGRLVASVFGAFSQYREYKKGTKELGLVIDIQTKETLISGLSQPHSLHADGNVLYLCNSETNELLIFSDEVLNSRIQLPGYARGLAISEGYIYVGLSRSRNVSNSEGISQATIAVICRDGLKLEGVTTIPFSEIYDIKLLGDKSDYILKVMMEYRKNDTELTALVNERLSGRDEYDRLLKDYEKSHDAYLSTKAAYDKTHDAYKQTKSAYDKKCEEIERYKRRYAR